MVPKHLNQKCALTVGNTGDSLLPLMMLATVYQQRDFRGAFDQIGSITIIAKP
jgi:hypothetical protein